MRLHHFCVLLLVTTIFLSGCWDQSNLKDKAILNGLTFDGSEDNPDVIHASVRALNIQSSGGGRFNIKDEVVATAGKNIPELDINLTNEILGEIDLSKVYVVVIGEELAKSKGILPLVTPIVRSRFGYVSAKLMIAEGRGIDILSIQMDYSPIAFRILNMFRNAEKRTHIPKETIFSIWNKITDLEQDALIPLVRRSGADQIEISGTALFNKDKYTGYSLSPKQSSLLLMMNNRFEKINLINIDHENTELKPFVISVDKIKHKTKLKLDEDHADGEIVFEVDIKLYAEIIHFEGKLLDKEIEKLNKISSDYMTEKAKEVTAILIEAESDVLGIQKEISSQYPNYLKDNDWKNVYSKIHIKPNFSVEIMGASNIN